MLYMTDVIEALRKIALRLERLEAEVTQVTDNLETLREAATGFPDMSRTRPKGRHRDRESEEVAKRLADRGVSKVHIHPHSDGSSFAEIEGVAVALPEKLALFLTVLCMSPSESAEEGGLIGWKSWDEVAVLMGKKAGKAGRHAVSQFVYRLRELLRAQGGNPYWVQTHRTRGVRFALRAKCSVIEEDSA